MGTLHAQCTRMQYKRIHSTELENVTGGTKVQRWVVTKEDREGLQRCIQSGRATPELCMEAMRRAVLSRPPETVDEWDI